MAVLLPEPESPVTTTTRKRGFIDILRSRSLLASRRVAIDLPRELESAVPAAAAEEMVARRGLDEHRHAAPRPHRDAHERQLHLEQRVAFLDQAQAIGGVGPLDQLDHEVELALVERGERAEQGLDVDDAEAADLQVVREPLGRAPAEDRRRDAPHDDDVVRHQPVAARHELEGGLALADAALAEDERAEAVDLDEVGVELGFGGELLLEPRGSGADEVAGAERGGEHRHVGRLRGLYERGRRRRPVGDHEAGHAGGGHRGDRRASSPGAERAEIGHLGVAEHLDAVGMELRQEAGQGEAGLLEAGKRDRALEAAAARGELEPEARGARLEQLAHRDAQYRSSSSRIVSKRSCAPPASMSRARNRSSLRRREMRASAFRCAPAESSGATRRKKRCVGFPSSDWKSTPRRLRPKAASTRFNPGSLPCGIATPSPRAVLFSRSRSSSAWIRRSLSISRYSFASTPASSAITSALLRPASAATTEVSWRMSVIFMARSGHSRRLFSDRGPRASGWTRW